jgi:hypothetical protein
MSNVYCPRTAPTYLWNAVWTATMASVLAVVFLAILPTTDGPAVLHEVAHPDACHACASSTPEARAVLDASLIESGAIEAPTASDRPSEGAGSVSWKAERGR